MVRDVWILLLLALTAPLAAQAIGGPVTPDDLRPHIAYLASEELEGRAPDSAGGRKAVHYIAMQWSAAGLQPGAASVVPETVTGTETGAGKVTETAGAATSWYQPVAMVTRKPLAGTIQFHGPGGAPIAIADRSLLLSGRDESDRLMRVPMVYVGYGPAAGTPLPDLTGKLALMLADRAEGDARNLADRAAALAAAGAAGVLLIFDPADPVQRLHGIWYRRVTELAARDAQRPMFYGGIEDDAARRLFTAAGDTLAQARLRALADDMQAEPMAITADLTARSEVTRLTSYNVLGRIAGRDPAAGAVLFMAHWDHLGLCRAEGAPQRICSGAVDNASGVAVLIEAAKRLAAAPAPDRDVYFLATTGEEVGLTGARAFAADPPVPLHRIVAAFNLDTVAIGPAGEPVAIIGRGITPIANDVARIALAMGRTMDADDDANAYIRRQDGWALLERGVPTVMVNGAFSDTDRLERFLSGPYHTPADVLTDDTDLSGAAEDADLHVALGRYFADARRYPAR